MHDPRFGPLTHAILGACIEVHTQLGPGLLESVYDECLAIEMAQRRIPFERQPRVPLAYKGVRVAQVFVPDFIVGGAVIVEVKAVQSLLGVHKSQLRTYLKLRRMSVGLLVNFDVPVLRDGGIRRITIPPNLPASSPPG